MDEWVEGWMDGWMEGCMGVRRYSSYSFTTSALDGGEWSESRSGRAFTSGERTPGSHFTGSWVGPRADLDTEVRGKILCPYGDRSSIFLNAANTSVLRNDCLDITRAQH
jgi:hypothetical protein